MPYEKRLKILDPMNGSGTVCIEALKFQEVTFCGGDISHLSSIMVNDNLIFFQMKNEILKKIYIYIEGISNSNKKKQIGF